MSCTKESERSVRHDTVSHFLPLLNYIMERRATAEQNIHMEMFSYLKEMFCFITMAILFSARCTIFLSLATPLCPNLHFSIEGNFYTRALKLGLKQFTVWKKINSNKQTTHRSQIESFPTSTRATLVILQLHQDKDLLASNRDVERRPCWDGASSHIKSSKLTSGWLDDGLPAAEEVSCWPAESILTSTTLRKHKPQEDHSRKNGREASVRPLCSSSRFL